VGCEAGRRNGVKHFLPAGDTHGISLQRDVWGLEVEREAASVDVQCLHFVPMVGAELLSDLLQEAGEGTDSIRIVVWKGR